MLCWIFALRWYLGALMSPTRPYDFGHGSAHLARDQIVHRRITRKKRRNKRPRMYPNCRMLAHGRLLLVATDGLRPLPPLMNGRLVASSTAHCLRTFGPPELTQPRPSRQTLRLVLPTRTMCWLFLLSSSSRFVCAQVRGGCACAVKRARHIFQTILVYFGGCGCLC